MHTGILLEHACTENILGFTRHFYISIHTIMALYIYRKKYSGGRMRNGMKIKNSYNAQNLQFRQVLNGIVPLSFTEIYISFS
jgi:hypothetical protein